MHTHMTNNHQEGRVEEEAWVVSVLQRLEFSDMLLKKKMNNKGTQFIL